MGRGNLGLVYPTVNRPDGGQVIGISTADMGTLFEEIWNAAVAGENDFYPIFLPWHADPRRTREWYEQTKRNMPNTYRREYPATPEEAFTAGSGAFFPEWDHDVHVIDEPGWYPPKDWRIVAHTIQATAAVPASSGTPLHPMAAPCATGSTIRRRSQTRSRPGRSSA